MYNINDSDKKCSNQILPNQHGDDIYNRFDFSDTIILTALKKQETKALVPVSNRI